MRLRLTTAAACVACASPAFAASSVSSLLNSSYADVKFGQTLAAIESYSLKTFQYVADTAWHPFGYLESGVTQLALWDLQHGTRTFEAAVSAALDKYATNSGPCHSHWKIPLANDFNDFASWTAIGSLDAYAAYGNETYLDWAKGMFQFVSDHGYIAEDDVNAGHLVNTKSKSNKLMGTCNGQSNIGGVYWQNGCKSVKKAQNNPTIAAVSTGAYALLGSSLCRITSNSTYCDRAYSSLQWLDRTLKRQGLIESHLQGNSCNTAQVLTAYNTALYLAAYADLGDQTGNATATSLSAAAALAAMKTQHWNNKQGIITSGSGQDLQAQNFQITFGPVLIRYLRRSYPYYDPTLQQAILDYVNIQYWSLTQKDASSPTQPYMYGRNWTGPGYLQASNESMVAALDVLNAVSLNPNSSFPSTSSTSTPVASSSASHCLSLLLALEGTGGAWRNPALAAIFPTLLLLCL